MIKTLFIAITIIAITWLTIEAIQSNNVNAILPQPLQNINSAKVAAGGGNAIGPLTEYYPKNIEIKTGQSVSWYNPTTVAEPHTVTFVFDNNTMAGVVSQLGVTNKSGFLPLPPKSNNAPILLPGNNGTRTIIALNAKTFLPVVIDSLGNAKYMSPNSLYTLNGTEKYVNSGWILPMGLEQGYPGSGNLFTVTFKNPGTYNYICILHPWMIGSVIVK
jgi:plastocyanin